MTKDEIQALILSTLQEPKMQDLQQELNQLRAEFQQEFGVQVLKQLSGRELLEKMFLNQGSNQKSNLCYRLEMDPAYQSFGGIKGGSAFKFGVFFSKSRNCWVKGSPQYPIQLSEQDAIAEATQIRDHLVWVAEQIESMTPFNRLEDYQNLSNCLAQHPELNKVWVYKYFHMIFPDVFCSYYGKDILKQTVAFIGESPSNDSLVNIGTLTLFARTLGIPTILLGLGLFAIPEYASLVNQKADTMSDEAQTRLWLISAGKNGEWWPDFQSNNRIQIGWETIQDFRKFSSKAQINAALNAEYGTTQTQYKNDRNCIYDFSQTMKPGDLVYVKNGTQTIVGRGKVTSDYRWEQAGMDPETSKPIFRHLREIQWDFLGTITIASQLPLKTLTNISSKTDLIQKIDAEIEKLEIEEGEPRDRTAPLQVREFPEYSRENFLEEVYMSEKDYNDLVGLLRYKKNIILQGPPGVGKTFASKRLAYSIMGKKNPEQVCFIQFHQNYAYEDFMMGFRPNEAGGFYLKDGVFYSFCKQAIEDQENDYFFIIDEINRGNLSRIFGELLMLVEADKRNVEMTLPYRNERFSIPSNLYLIGMMNTADRSLALMDYALRRRFAFVTMKPGFQSDGFSMYQTGLASERFDQVIQVITQLNDEIAGDPGLGEGFCIGHSFFCNLEADQIEEHLPRILCYEIIPLLEEYWFDQPQKVRNWKEALLGAAA